MATQTQRQFESRETHRGKVEPISEEFRGQASSLAEDIGIKMKEYYEDASTWLQQNYGKTLLVVGILAAAGLTGYFLARNPKEHEKIPERQVA